MKKNPEAQAVAFKKCRSKILKIKALGITPDMSPEDEDKIVNDLATARAIEDGKSVDEVFAGQAWYVENLKEFSAMTPAEQLEFEYNDCFVRSASEEELIEALAQLAA